MSNLHTAASAAVEALHDPHSQKAAGDIVIGIGAVTSPYWLSMAEGVANHFLLWGGVFLLGVRIYSETRRALFARRRSDDLEG